MDRAIVVALAAAALVLVAVIGAGLGFVATLSDPEMQARQQCDHTQSGPGVPQGCRNFKVIARTGNRVEFAYDTNTGDHCEGYVQSERRGPLGLGGGMTMGGSACSPAGQPIARGPVQVTPYPDGNPPCLGALALAGPLPTPTGFAIIATNTGPTTCEIAGPAKLIFLDSGSRPLAVPEQPAAETAAAVILGAGQAARLDFDAGGSGCWMTTRIIVSLEHAGGSVSGPFTICGPVVAHTARPA